MTIKFGTDGWRGFIADDFTFDNVRKVAGAIASYVLKHEDPARGVLHQVSAGRQFKERAVVGLGFAQGFLHAPAFGDVLDRAEHFQRTPRRPVAHKFGLLVNGALRAVRQEDAVIDLIRAALADGVLEGVEDRGAIRRR